MDLSFYLSRFCSLVAAIQRLERIEVKCQLLSRQESYWCWIAPHVIGFGGSRWHARTFCRTDQSFKDFLLCRIIETRGTKSSKIRADGDADWNEQVTLEKGSHPELSETQQKVIALHYGRRSGRTKIPVRKALFYCALKRLDLDTDPAARQPQDQQIILLNCQAGVWNRSYVGSHQELS